jgi:diguanylate cyclase (GGDEF)-like protein
MGAWPWTRRLIAAGGPQQGPSEPASRDQRLGLLLVVRLGLVAVVLLTALFASDQVGIRAVDVWPISAAYLAVAVGAEWYRRRPWPGRIALQGAILPLDAVYLAIVTTPGGGPRSPLIVLFSVQLIAATLLVSERAGISMALWDSFLLIIIPTLSLSKRITSLLGVGSVAAPPAADTALAIVGFWLVALCTVAFSSVRERQLRRSQADLEALAGMAARLGEMLSETEVLALLLETLLDGFSFRRGAVWWTRLDRAEGLARPGPDERVRPVPVDPHRQPDRIAAAAWAARRALVAPRLDPAEDPVAAALLPSARDVVVLPLQIDSRDSGIVLLEQPGDRRHARLSGRTLLVLSQFAAHAALALRNARLLAERERRAAIDGLTGLANRREFDRVLAREVNRAGHTGEPLSLVVFDIDHFKLINDSRGHLAGDEVLRSIGQLLAGAVRDMDLVARYGGEEFALVLPRCDQPDAVLVMGRVSDAIRRHPGLAGITVSSGVATLPANASNGIALIAAADEAMYESKRAGRDRLTVSGRRCHPESAAGPGSP